MENDSSLEGCLIVIEGIDGSGKSTLADKLGAWFTADGREVVRTAEPTDGPSGRRIRELTRSGRREEMSPIEELSLFEADRKEHVDRLVRPALARGAVVIQDRSYFSTMAYQSGRGLDATTIRERSEAIAPRPDVLLVLDIPVAEAHRRIREVRGDAGDDFERTESLERARRIFAGISEAIHLDATASPDAIFEQACAVIGGRGRTIGA